MKNKQNNKQNAKNCASKNCGNKNSVNKNTQNKFEHGGNND